MVFLYANYSPVTDVHKHLYVHGRALQFALCGGGRVYICVYKCVWYVWCCTVHNYVEVHCVCVHVYSTLCLCTCVPNVEDSGDAGVCMFVLTWVSYEDYIGLHGWNNPSSA